MPNAGALGGFSVSYVNDGQLNLNWDRGTSSAERIYFSRWNQADNTWGGEFWVSSVLLTGTEARTDITFNRRYRYRARGWRADGGHLAAQGFGPYLYSDYVQTSPAAPSSVTAGLSGPNAIALSWVNNATNPFYEYATQVYAKIDGSDWIHQTTHAPGVTSQSFTGLNPGSGYAFLVRHISTNAGQGTLYSADITTGWTTSIGVPAAVTGVTATRATDSQATVSWTNNSSAGAPYTNIAVHRWDSVSNVWTHITNVGGSTTTITDNGLVAGRKYWYHLYASNAVGTSGVGQSNYIYTTPLAPSGVTAQYTGGTTVKVSWTNPGSYAEYSLRMQAYKNGVAEGSTVTLPSGTTTTNVTVTAGDNYYYRVWTVSDTGSLASAQTQSNNIIPATAPNAPTGMATSAAYVDIVNVDYSISWTHSPADGSAQTKYRLSHRVQGSSTWTVGPIVTSSQSTAFRPFSGQGYSNGSVIEWCVQTWGVHANPSAYGATVTTNTATLPTVVITGPTSLANSTVTVTWAYTQAQGSAQSEWIVDLYDTATGSLVASQTGVNANTSVTMPFPAVDGGAYRADVKVRSSHGLWSALYSKSFLGLFTPPAEVSFVPDVDLETGAGVLALALPEADKAGQVAATNLILNPGQKAGGGSDHF